MKLSYKVQIIISIIIIPAANILTDLFVVNPAVPNGTEANKRAVFWTRMGGVLRPC